VNSTQLYLKDALKNNRYRVPVCIATLNQTDGVGSRGNSWIGMEGNLFFSFAVLKNELPNDLKLESASIYFMSILKDLLSERGSLLWLKWPNDLYIGKKKLGGCITNIQGDTLICGIGLNIKKSPDDFAVMDIDFDSKELLKAYMTMIEKKIPWKQIFSKYKLEFENNKRMIPYINGGEISLLDTQIMDDGSLICNGQRIYSLR